jgi:hypothetical protein
MQKALPRVAELGFSLTCRAVFSTPTALYTTISDNSTNFKKK